MPRQVVGQDRPLLDNWFKKGYSSKEMAMFLLLTDMADNPGFYRTFRDRVENSFNYYHNEVCRNIYKAAPPEYPSDGSSRGNMLEDDE